MIVSRARMNDVLALLTSIVVIALDQWTKALVVAHLSPPGSSPIIRLLGPYLVIFYIQNRGAAFGLFADTSLLIVLIAVAVGVISYLYVRMLNSGSLLYKITFGMIIGGAIGNLIDRIHNGGYVVDFLSFRIPQINYYFAIFNLADASISIGVFLLFIAVLLFGGQRSTASASSESSTKEQPTTMTNSTHRSREQDA